MQLDTPDLADINSHTFLNDEAQIRDLIDSMARFIDARDVDGIMSAYAPEAVIFDVRDALFVDKDTHRESWEECFDVTDNYKMETHNLSIRVDESQAFSHCLSHVSGKSKNGEAVDLWMRITECFSKINGNWYIVHEHSSVPGDFTTGKIMQKLQPIFYPG